MNKLEKVLDKTAKIAGFIAVAYVIVDGTARTVIMTKDMLKKRRIKKEAKAAASAA